MKIHLYFINQSRQEDFKNIVYAINDMNGQWQDNLQDVNKAFLTYYKQLQGFPLMNKTKVKRVVIEKGQCYKGSTFNCLKALTQHKRYKRHYSQY